ncbi:MAG: preprotein translocase subunit YajC [Candidatus Kapaibacteriales bacterium]
MQNLFMFQAADGGGLTGTLIMFGAMFVVLYFFMIRPQQKRQKEHQKMLSEISSGDRVVTSSGIYGVVKSVDEQSVHLDVGSNTIIRFQKASIASLPDKVQDVKTSGKK